ncbi:hypothetical protein BD311DRAFT_564088 [Dichomitus squalens]|uniref:C2H2-type domain-containing protein n=1 Tax=Dichomitus squalens TaxID=114155 RepID=A0A4V2JZA8_9APHY|nr:hypothetical protein BD311DRAFT_564088 [Dichomitus squalens]
MVANLFQEACLALLQLSVPVIRRSERLRKQAKSHTPTIVPTPPATQPEKGSEAGRKLSATMVGPSNAYRSSQRSRRKRRRSDLSTDDVLYAPPESAPKRNRTRRPPIAGQALVVVEGEQTIHCEICSEKLTLTDLDAIVKHFSGHYHKKQKATRVPCLWGNCAVKYKNFQQVVRHLKQDHLKVMWACPHCGERFGRIDCVRRHQEARRACVSNQMLHPPSSPFLTESYIARETRQETATINLKAERKSTEGPITRDVRGVVQEAVSPSVVFRHVGLSYTVLPLFVLLYCTYHAGYYLKRDAGT